MELQFQHHSRFPQLKISNLQLIQLLSVVWLVTRRSNLYRVDLVMLIVSQYAILSVAPKLLRCGFLKENCSSMWPSQFHHSVEKVIFCLPSISEKRPLKFWFGTEEISTIVTSYQHYFFSTCYKPSQFLNEWVRFHVPYCYKERVTTWQAGEYNSISLNFLLVVFDREWTKHVKPNIRKGWFCTNAVCWKFCHFLLSNLST